MRKQKTQMNLAAAYGASLALLASGAARGTSILYFDNNGSGTGLTTTGTWNATNTNWSTAAAGNVATGLWVLGDTASFGAAGTVTLSDTETIGGINFSSGAVTISGAGTLGIGSNSITINNATASNQSLDVPVTGSGNLAYNYTNTAASIALNLSGPMSEFTGNLIIGAGTSSTALATVQLDYSLGSSTTPTNVIDLSNYSLLSDANPVTTGIATPTPTSFTLYNNINLNYNSAVSTAESWISASNGIGGVSTYGASNFSAGTQKIETYVGVISGTSDVTFGIANGGGRGTVILGNSNTYTGNTYVVLANTNGLLQLGVNNAIPATSTLTFGTNPAFATNASAIAPLDLNGHNLTIAGLGTSTTSTSATGVGNIYNLGANSSTLTINGSGSTTFKGDIGDTNLNTNPFNDNAPYVSASGYSVSANTGIALNYNGSGSLTLAPVSAIGNGNEFTGDTNVNSGTLVLGRVSTGAASSNYTLENSNIKVNSGGTLSSASSSGNTYVGGSGGTITLNSGSIFSPGGAGATALLSTNNLVINSGSILDFDVNSLGSFDQVQLAGSLTLDSTGTHTVNIASTSSQLTAGTFPLIESGNGISWDGTNGFSLGTLPSGSSSYSISISGNNVDLVVSGQALRWDPTGNGPPVTEGGGTWTNGTSTFVNLATGTDTNWNNSASSAVIIGDDSSQEGGSIVLGSSIVTGLLTFGPIYPGQGNGYSITDGGDPAYTLTTGGIVANSTASIDANVLLNGNQNWSVDSGQTLTLTHPLNQSSPSILSTGGAGTIVLQGSGGNISGLQVNSGTTALLAVDAVGSAPITINGGQLGLGVSATYVNDITFGSNGGGIGPYGGASATVSKNLSSSATVNIAGSGTLTLTGSNSFAALNLSSATLVVSSNAALGSGPIKFTGGGLTISAITTLQNNLSFSTTGTIGNGNQLSFGAGPLTLSGVLSGSGDLHVYGSGILTLSGSNTFSGGAFYIENPMTVSVTNPAGLSTGTIAVDAATTLDIEANVNSGPIRGSAVWTKTGPGTLIVSGSSVTTPLPGLGVILQQGNIQLNSVTGLGGSNNTASSAAAPQAAITINPGTQLLINTSGQRASGNITLNGGSIIRTSAAPAADFAFTIDSVDVTAGTGFVYNYTNNFSPALTVIASSLIDNNEQAIPGTASQDLLITEPVVVNTGAKLTIESDNTAGNFEQAGVILRGTTNNTLDPYQSVTLQAGSTIAATGPGDVDFGGTGRGEPVIALGSPGSDALLQLGSHSFLRDTGAATQNQNATDSTRLIIDGSGSAGLRIEAPMNATYTVPNASGAPSLRTYDGTTGLFGINTTATAAAGTTPAGYTTIGNGFTVFSPNRAARLSSTYQLPSGQVITPAGTLTLAATDPGGATGVVNAGPAQSSNISLALDNTASSGNLIYQIDPTANEGSFANFAGLTVERSYPSEGTVTAQLLGNTTIPSLNLSSASLDVSSHDLIVTQGSLSTINAEVTTGYNHGNWNGSPGIVSSSAAGDSSHLTAVGVILNDDGQGNPLYGSNAPLGLFGGLSPATDAVLVKYAYYGDTDLNGQVDGNDYSRIDVGYLDHLTGWANGDFNYDGVVDGSDYTLMDNAFNTQGASLAAELASDSTVAVPTAQIAASIGTSSVPEPATLSLIAMAPLGLLGRRRRPQ